MCQIIHVRQMYGLTIAFLHIIIVTVNKLGYNHLFVDVHSVGLALALEVLNMFKDL